MKKTLILILAIGFSITALAEKKSWVLLSITDDQGRTYEIKALKNSTELDLQGKMARTITGLEKLPKLVSLNVMDNRLDLTSLKKLKQLKTLIIGYNELTDLKPLEHLVNLEYLDLRFNQLKKIEGLSKLHKLKTLDLSYNQIEKIEGLSTLKNLEGLILSNNNISKIENLPKQPKLKYISLDDNQIEALSGLEGIKQELTLYLFKNPAFGGQCYPKDKRYPKVVIIKCGKD